MQAGFVIKEMNVLGFLAIVTFAFPLATYAQEYEPHEQTDELTAALSPNDARSPTLKELDSSFVASPVGTIAAGRVFDWPESGFLFVFDDFVQVTSGINGWWSINTLNPPRGWYYGYSHPTVEIAPAHNVTHISEVVDASVFDYEPDWSAGPMEIGEFVLFRNTQTGFFAAFRVDDIYSPDGDAFNARTNVTWYLQEDGSADFSSFVSFDDFESGDLSFWSAVIN